MEKRSKLLLYFIALVVFSCGSEQNTPKTISDMNIDFPTSEDLAFNHFMNYDIDLMNYCAIDDSILWNFEEMDNSLGTCYNLHTGKRLSTIVSKGKADYELMESPSYRFLGDSVQFQTYSINSSGGIKTFSKKEIIADIPMNERNFSHIIPPQTIYTIQMIKLHNGKVLSTVGPTHKSDHESMKTDTLNKKSIVIFGDNEINGYETIDYKSIKLKKFPGPSRRLPGVTANDQIKLSYANAHIELKGDDIAVLTVNNQFMLYTLNLKSGKVIKEKNYTEMLGIGPETGNEMYVNINNIKSTNNYILTKVFGYLSKEDKEAKTFKEAIFVFDWDLNPIKRYNLPYQKSDYYILSNDCTAVYHCNNGKNGLTLSKADLNLE